MRDAFLRRRDLMVRLFSAIPDLKVNTPDGAFYLFPDVSTYFGKKTPAGDVIHDSTDLCNYILTTFFVSVVSGEAFGNDNCIRLSFAAADDKLVEAAKRITAAFAALS
jgi:aspartate aminotransferase